MKKRLYLKIDVDTERGTRVGVPNLQKLLDKFDYKATFLFSLGPDNTGRALKRIFRPGFLKKVSRTSVISTYGIRTLLNGVFIPGPHIAKRHGALMQAIHNEQHEVGIHCYDHIRWQDGLAKMTKEEVFAEMEKALTTFETTLKFKAKTAGAAGWQANAHSLEAYDKAGFVYASDTRGYSAYFPKVNNKQFNTLQIPTTLPTLDELIGRPEYPEDKLIDYYYEQITQNSLNVLTIHAELEGMKHLPWFEALLKKLNENHIEVAPLIELANMLLKDKETIPVCEMIQGEIDGRSGKLAMQGYRSSSSAKAGMTSVSDKKMED